MLRVVVAICYGTALLITWLTFIGIFFVPQRHALLILGGWAFCTAGLFAIGRFAHLAQRDHGG